MTARNYYVYVYIDPRNHEEFYYGKGRGKRRFAHLNARGDSEKVARILAIKKAGLSPIIRTIAAGLTEHEAFLVVATLLWKLNKRLTNHVAGRFASLFRPHDTLHRELPGFDFQHGVYYVNIGEGPHRHWDDCRRLGFLSASGPRWRDQIRDLVEGDIVVPYLKGKGYVGIGKVAAQAMPYIDYRHQGRPLHDFNLTTPRMAEHMNDPEKTEYVMRVEWKVTVPRTEAKWQAKSGLFTTQLVRASLKNQPQTIRFLERAFFIPNLQALAG